MKSLHEKKHRNETGLFLVEGAKNITELLDSDYIIDSLLVTKIFFEENKKLIENKNIICDIVDQNEIEKVSTLESNDAALAVVKQKENTSFVMPKNELFIALDDVRDPGNLGTIIRIADWYGIKNIIASETTADFYNSKVISATKGSFMRVNVFYTDLSHFLSQTKLPILGAFLEGENVHTVKFPKEGILLMGNESRGISEDIEKYVSKKITIPSFGKAESLNVSVATAVILDNWKRAM
ncbi:MAG: RNA methyltransferase [bacterium]